MHPSTDLSDTTQENFCRRLHDAIAVTSITDDVVHVGFAGGDRHENIRRETVLCSAFLKV
jgi:hypothetical protein